MRPVTAQPGYTENDVKEVMASQQFVYADCFTFLPKVGSPLRYTNGQQDVSVVPVGGGPGRVTYSGQQLVISGLRVRNNIGVEVDEQEVEISYPDTPIYQASLTWAQALLQGRLDGARIRRDRYIATAWGQPWLGGFPMFEGLVSTLDKVGRQSGTIHVKSDLVLLDTQMPRDLFESGCKNTWGDGACGVIQSDWSVLGVVGSSPTRTVIPWSSSNAGYALGKVHITDSDSVTRVRTISRADATHLYLTYPLDFDPYAGMDFTAFPGCVRTMDPTYGCPRFHGVDWVERFKGFPFIPVAETAA